MDDVDDVDELDDEDDVDDVDDEDDVDDDEDVDADEDGARTRPAANEARPPPLASEPPGETSREKSSRAASGSDGSHTRIIRGRSSDEGEVTGFVDDEDGARRVGGGVEGVRAVAASDAAKEAALSGRRAGELDAGELDAGIGPLVAQIVGARTRGRRRRKGSSATRNAARRMLADLEEGGAGEEDRGGGEEDRGAGKRKISHPAVDDDGGGAPTPKRAAGARGTVRGTDRGTVAAVAAPRAGMTMTTTNAAAVAAALRAGRTVLVTGAAVAALTNPAAAAALARRSRPTAEDAQVALRLGELCATVGVDVTPEMIDRFRDDLSRCPESVRSLLAPLARGVDPIIAPLRALLRFNAPRAEGTEAGTAAAEDTEAGTAAATPAPAAAPAPAPPRPRGPRGPRPRPRGPRPRPCGPRPRVGDETNAVDRAAARVTFPARREEASRGRCARARRASVWAGDASQRVWGETRAQDGGRGGFRAAGAGRGTQWGACQCRCCARPLGGPREVRESPRRRETSRRPRRGRRRTRGSTRDDDDDERRS